MSVAILQSSKLNFSVPPLSAFVVTLCHLLLPPALSQQLDDTARASQSCTDIFEATTTRLD